MVSGALVGAVAIGVGAAAAFGSLGGSQAIQKTAATDNMNCTLIVPANPLTAQGLATPYQLTATNPADGACNEANPNQTAFVQAAVINPANGQISVYNPLVVDQGTTAGRCPGRARTAGRRCGRHLVRLQRQHAVAGGRRPGGGHRRGDRRRPPRTATPVASSTAATAAAGTATATPTPLATPASTAAAAVATTPTGTTPATANSAGPSTIVNPAVSTAPSATASAASAGTVTTPAVTGTTPPAATDTPAASGTPDAILQGANCVAGENIAGQGFSSFTQMAACNAPAFFAAANTAIGNGQLTVPNPGTAADGQSCLTTRNFGVIDQDQSDNVTTKYLATANGQIAQDTAANTAQLAGATTLVNGSDNGLIDFFMDPALHCTPWTVPDLASPGTTAPALPLDELQSAAFDNGNGGPPALVPLNDPMTLDNNGNSSTDKTNAYRSIVDQSVLPAGETPAEYCGDMESIQGIRLQQDVNLLINGPSPMPAEATNLFTFLAMRLQQSFTNLNCQNFGLQNDVSTTVNGNGIVVAACFRQQVNAVTAGAGNPTFGMTVCPATTTSATPTASATTSAGATAAPTSTVSASPTGVPPTGRPAPPGGHPHSRWLSPPRRHPRCQRSTSRTTRRRQPSHGRF